MNTDNITLINAYGENQPVIIIDGNAYPIGYDTSTCTATAEDIAEGKTAATSEGIVTGTAAGELVAIAKVADFKLPHDEFTAVGYIDVTGFGLTDTYDGEIDLSAWNGRYSVTPETANKTSAVERIYKHSELTKYIYHIHDDDWGEDKWIFSDSLNTVYIPSAQVYSSNLQSGSWNNYNLEYNVQLTLENTEVTYPQQDLVIEVNSSTGYTEENDIRQWEFAETPQTLESYDVVPNIGALHCVLRGKTLSNPVYTSDRQGVNGLVFRGDMTTATPELGSFTPSGEVSYSSEGIQLNGKYITTDIPVAAFAGDFTLSFDVIVGSTSRTAFFAAYDGDCRIGMDTNARVYNVWAGNSGWNILSGDDSPSDNENSSSGRSRTDVKYNTKQHIVFKRTGDIWELYVDGELALRRNRPGKITTGGYIAFNRWGNGSYVSSDIVFSNIVMYTQSVDLI